MTKEFGLINNENEKVLELTFEELLYIDDSLTLGIDAL